MVHNYLPINTNINNPEVNPYDQISLCDTNLIKYSNATCSKCKNTDESKNDVPARMIETKLIRRKL